MFPPRDRRYLRNPWFYNEAPETLVPSGNIRQIRKETRKLANEELADFFVEHLREWADLARGATDIGSIDEVDIRGKIGDNIELLVAFLRQWLDGPAKEKLLTDLIGKEDSSTASLDPRTVTRAYQNYLAARRFDSPELESARKEALAHVGTMAEAMREWHPYTRGAWELTDGTIVFPDEHPDRAAPRNIYLVKNARGNLTRAIDWLEHEDEFIIREQERLGIVQDLGPMVLLIVVKIPETFLACLSGQVWTPHFFTPDERPVTEDEARGWKKREPEFRGAMSTEAIMKEMLDIIQNINDIDMGRSGKVPIPKRLKSKVIRTMWGLWKDDSKALVVRCVDHLQQYGLIEITRAGQVRLTPMGKELCRLKIPEWRMYRLRRPARYEEDLTGTTVDLRADNGL